MSRNKGDVEELRQEGRVTEGEVVGRGWSVGAEVARGTMSVLHVVVECERLRYGHEVVRTEDAWHEHLLAPLLVCGCMDLQVALLQIQVAQIVPCVLLQCITRGHFHCARDTIIGYEMHRNSYNFSVLKE